MFSSVYLILYSKDVVWIIFSYPTIENPVEWKRTRRNYLFYWFVVLLTEISLYKCFVSPCKSNNFDLICFLFAMLCFSTKVISFLQSSDRLCDFDGLSLFAIYHNYFQIFVTVHFYIFIIRFINWIFSLPLPVFLSIFLSSIVVIHELLLIICSNQIFLIFLVIFHIDLVSFILRYTTLFLIYYVEEIFNVLIKHHVSKASIIRLSVLSVVHVSAL